MTVDGRSERKAPLCRVGRSMNLRKQVEPLGKAALQASSIQRHAHHAASRLTWVKRWLKRAYRHHAQSRELKLSTDLSADRCRCKVRACETASVSGSACQDVQERCRCRYAIRTRSSRRSSSRPARRARRRGRAWHRGSGTARRRCSARRAPPGAASRRSAWLGGRAHLLVDVAAPAARRTPGRARCGSDTAARGFRRG